MRKLVPEFEVVASEIDESAFDHPEPGKLACLLAEAKALAVAKDHPDANVLGADTMVVAGSPGQWRVLGKPADAAQAREMLESLSGTSHLVLTGVCVVSADLPGGSSKFLGITHVYFDDLRPEVIEAYIGTGSPFDKAGAYGIQDIGCSFVRRISGSRDNVIGLPVELLQRELGRLSVL